MIFARGNVYSPDLPADASEAARRRPTFRELALVLALFCAVNLHHREFQKPISHGQGAPWDAAGYVFMAKRFAADEPIAGTAPFIYRIGAPYLASFLDLENPVRVFRRVNGVANLLTTVLLLFWLARFVSRPWVRVLLCAVFITHWNGPVRFIFYISPITDPWAAPFVLLGLFAIESLREPRPARDLAIHLAFCACIFVGTLFREYVALLGIAALFTRNPVHRRSGSTLGFAVDLRPALPFLPALAAALAGLLATRLVSTPTNEFSFLWTALELLHEKSLSVYLYAWLLTFGPLLFLLLHEARDAGRFLTEHQALAVLLAGIAFLAWVGGGHTERFVFWTAPLVYLLAGRAIERNAAAIRSLPIGALLGAALALTGRLFWLTPDYPGRATAWTVPLLTMIGPGTRLFDLLSFESHWWHVLALEAEHVAVGLLLIASLRARRDPAVDTRG